MGTDLRDPSTPEGQDDSRPVVVTPDMRKQLLGRLVEFELALQALPPREQMFALAVIADPTNLQRAGVRAGMSEQSAGKLTAGLLKKGRVAHAVALGNLIREDRTMVTSERTINELALLAYSDITDFVVENGQLKTREGIPAEHIRAVQQVEFNEVDHYEPRLIAGEWKQVVVRTTRHSRIKLWSKTDTLRMLALYQKLIAASSMVVNNNDNRGQQHTHNHSWQIGDRVVNF